MQIGRLAALLVSMAVSVSVTDAHGGHVRLLVAVDRVPLAVRVAADSGDFVRSSEMVVTAKHTWIEWEDVPSGLYVVESRGADGEYAVSQFWMP